MGDAKVKILSMGVNVITISQALDHIIHLAKEGRGNYVCVSNVHMCMEVFDSNDFANVVNGADLVIPDGRPISWAQRLLGHRDAQQVRGQDITEALCKLSASEGIKVGFYGGASPELLNRVAANLRESYPNINIAYQYSPPFRPLTKEEDERVVGEINACELDLLFVGIGCPKQERWMAEHKPHLRCVMLGVGAAFDFIAGEKKHAPRWMQKTGFEWLFRFFSEPRRLWHRYLKQNPRFVYFFLQQILFKRRFD